MVHAQQDLKIVSPPVTGMMATETIIHTHTHTNR